MAMKRSLVVIVLGMVMLFSGVFCAQAERPCLVSFPKGKDLLKDDLKLVEFGESSYFTGDSTLMCRKSNVKTCVISGTEVPKDYLKVHTAGGISEKLNIVCMDGIWKPVAKKKVHAGTFRFFEFVKM
eukprot:814119_1